ncbi:type II secretion system protein, partial [Candidatus Desantisbacteria bacterium]|nr:type II secretion system protein [Candidatus Desantisbacteria bacterium]
MRCVIMEKGYSLLESLVSFAVLAIVILAIVFFLSEGLRSYMRTENRPLIKAQQTVRELLNGKAGDRRYGLSGEIRSLIALSKADRTISTFVKNSGERYGDINFNGLFDTNESIVFDEDKSFSYEQGTDTLILGTTPEQGFPLANFNPEVKHTDNGSNAYKFDSSEAVVYDANDNNLYDTGETVLVGATPENGAEVVPFGNTITYYLDIANREVKRVENNAQPVTVGKDIFVDLPHNIFGLRFSYFDK